MTPSPLDADSPRRTTSESKGVIRWFQGSIIGRRGAEIRSRGGDLRVVVKEWSGYGEVGGVGLGSNEVR